MSNDSNDICAICHDNLGEDVYTLPECNHKFHTNCIMTWFRSKRETCPLCNNRGINATHSQITNEANNCNWYKRKKYLKLYSAVSKKCRKKNASKKMKKDVEKVRKYEKKFKEFKNQKKKWLKTKHENMTANQIISHNTKLQRKQWQMQKTVNRKKRIVGYLYGECVTNIIIPEKVNV